MRVLSLLFFLSTPVLAAAPSYGKADLSITFRTTSIVALIAHPENFQGKKVRIIGALNLQFEGNVICLHKEDLSAGLSANCLWIEPDLKALGTSLEKLEQMNGKYVLVEGVFDSRNTGHLGCCSGALTRAWRMQVWGE